MYSPSSGKHKAGVVVVGLFVLTCMTIIPTVVHPRLYPEYYREKQKWIRDKVPQEKRQPGGMKVWSDPFDRKKKK